MHSGHGAMQKPLLAPGLALAVVTGFPLCHTSCTKRSMREVMASSDRHMAARVEFSLNRALSICSCLRTSLPAGRFSVCRAPGASWAPV